MPILPWFWVVFTLAAATAQTLRNAMQHELTERLGTLGATLVRFLFGLPFAGIFLAVALYATDAMLPEYTTKVMLFCAGAAVTQIGATGLMLAAMRERSFVVTTAYTKTEPLQVAIFGLVVLGEHITPALAAAILISTMGVIVISWPKNVAGSEAYSWRPALLGLASGSLFAFSAVGFRGAIKAIEAPNFVVAALSCLFLGLAIQVFLLCVYLLLFNRETLKQIIVAWRPSLFAGFMGAFASMGWFLAFAVETAARVRTLALVEILIAQLVSRRMLKQGMSARDVVGIILMVIGVILVLNS